MSVNDGPIESILMDWSRLVERIHPCSDDYFGMWLDEMSEAIRPVVEGQVVWDLGAGSLAHARRLLSLGAHHVIAVDRVTLPPPRDGEAITTMETLFRRLQVPSEGIRVALVAWPINRVVEGLVGLLERADVVIYLGSNVDGTACGGRDLWAHLYRREILNHVPHHRNTLIVYGSVLEESRPLLGEEIAATSKDMLSFTKAQDERRRLWHEG